MRNAFRVVLRFLSESNLFISAGSFFSILGACAYVSIPLDYQLGAFAFFAALFTYNFQRRIGDLQHDQSFSKTTAAMMAAGIMGMVYFCFRLEFFELAILAFSGLISLAYAFPFIPSSRGKLSLRLLPRIKLWAIVLVWTISCAFLPLLGNALNWEVIALFTIQQATFITALTIPFDIRDLSVDFPQQKTIPQVYGVLSARKIAYIFLAISALVSLLVYFLKISVLETTLFHLAILFVSGILISKARTKNSEFYFTIAIDGMIILQGASFLLAKYYI